MAEALGTLQYVPRTQKEKMAFLIAARDTKALSAIGQPAIEALVAQLRTSDDDGAFYAAQALGQLGNAGIAQLIACLRDEQPRVRLFVANTLEFLGIKEAIPSLHAALPDWEARGAIIFALKRLGWHPESERDQVYLWLSDLEGSADYCRVDPERVNARWAQAKRVLLEDLGSGEQKRREYAAFAFIAMGKEETIPVLIEALDKHGTRRMAETYLMCENERLADAARRWASKHGADISPARKDFRFEWGAFPSPTTEFRE